ncbi:4'-phosphopantetheinyl transferase superfamily protein [Colwellia sp. RSH04]|uniref:4'-phosphopantetheinyl transferase family protein n=1 Tax=Colwellia sp. RSH04 TaxID=2305464 RepID=UPI000E56D6C4|nr:4'-phosphopantetheinyl transferase superfamily protein [Colwellia sp. RSH04]RHW75784.1 hypothetical protein D1094_11735 [Colwellia sp. RSH04]
MKSFLIKQQGKDKTLYIGKMDTSKNQYQQDYLSSEELLILAKRQRKASEFIFSRYLIKKALNKKKQQAKILTIKYCPEIGAAGVFQQQELIQKLSLSHSGEYIAFSFCALNESIGVDIEQKTNRDIASIALNFYCEEDRELIHSSQNPINEFYKIWTEKEALTKLLNTSIFNTLNESSSVLKRNYQLSSLIEDDYVVSIATKI